PEDAERLRPDGHRRPPLEHDGFDHVAPAAERPTRRQGILHALRLQHHVPEPLRPLQIDDEKHRAQDDERKRDAIADMRQGTILFMAEQFDERAEEVTSRGDAAEEEVEDDPPAPIGGFDEGVHAVALPVVGGFAGPDPAALASAALFPLVRLRNANSTPSAVMIAVNTLQNDDRTTPRLGTLGFEGRP